MASIQCAIELYDGVSPVLKEMGLALESFSGRLIQFGEEMGAVSPDVEGILGFREALGGLADEGQRAYEVLANVLASSKGLSDVFSEDFFAPFDGWGGEGLSRDCGDRAGGGGDGGGSFADFLSRGT